MSQPGLGVMISYLGGNEDSVNALKAALGKTIDVVELVEDALRIKFTDETGIYFYDDGQSCCEHRYMVCDDDLLSFSAATLDAAELADAPEVEDEYGEVHEVQFLRVSTSKGVIVVSNHNEHNGYYGGFSIRVRSI